MITNEVKDFFTVSISEYNNFLGKETEKKYYLYDKKNKKLCINSIFTCPFLKNNFILPEKKEEYNFIDSLELRESQKIITNKILENSKKNIYCGLIKLAPGGGKTILTMWLTKFFGLKTLILTKNSLINQTITEFKNLLNVECGKYNSAKKDIKKITITTHKSFTNCYDTVFADFDVILYDECHEALTKNMFTALAGTNAKILYGLSGTPTRKEFNIKDMQKIFGPLLEDINFKEPFKIEVVNLNYYHYLRYITESVNYADLRTVMGLHNERQAKQKEYIEKILNSRSGDVIIMSDRLDEINFYLSFLEGIENIADTVNPRIDGKKVTIPEIINFKAKNKKRLVIIGQYKKIGTGLDHPPLRTAILFQSISIKETVEQGVGRITRIFKGKKNVKAFFWNDSNLFKQRLEKIKTMKTKFGNDVKIHEIKIESKKPKYKFFLKSDKEYKQIEDFNNSTELKPEKLSKNHRLEKDMTTDILGEYRKKGFFCHKISDESRGAKPYDCDVNTRKNIYCIEYKMIDGGLFDSKILRDVQYSNLLKKLENPNITPLVGVYSKCFGILKYIHFKLISDNSEIKINLFE